MQYQGTSLDASNKRELANLTVRNSGFRSIHKKRFTKKIISAMVILQQNEGSTVKSLIFPVAESCDSDYS